MTLFFAAKKTVKKRPGKGGVTAKTGQGRKPRGRVGKKGGQRAKKKPQINGLDVLHSQTVLSTVHSDGQKLPAAPGCIDLQLMRTSLSRGIPVHEEIAPDRIPTSVDAKSVPPELQVLFSWNSHFNILNLLMLEISNQVYLDTVRDQLLGYMEQFKDRRYAESIKRDIELERERKNSLSLQAAQLDQQVFLSVIGYLWHIVLPYS